MLMLFLASLALALTPASPDYAGHCQSPRWSPDGRWLAWEVNYLERQAVELYVTPFGSGSPPRQVQPTATSSSLTAGFSTGKGRMVSHELTFSPAALNRFVYSSSGAAEDYELYLDGGGVLAGAPGADGNPAWSPDGKLLAFTSARTGQGDLYLITLGQPTAVPLKLSGDPVASELYASWSPNSTSLAFVGHTSKGDNLYLIDNVNFPAPKPITSWSGVQTRPSFSPDGTRIAFYANHEKEDRFDLYVMSVGSEPVRLAQNVLLNPRGPSWTPDGASIVFVKNDPDRFNPVWRVSLADPSKARMVATGTVGNQDLDVVKRSDGKTWLAVSAQGRTGDAVRDFRRVYALPID